MKSLLTFLTSGIICASSLAQTFTDLRLSNGVVVAPTNFWTANSNSIVNIAGSSGDSENNVGIDPSLGFISQPSTNHGYFAEMGTLSGIGFYGRSISGASLAKFVQDTNFNSPVVQIWQNASSSSQLSNSAISVRGPDGVYPVFSHQGTSGSGVLLETDGSIVRRNDSYSSARFQFSGGSSSTSMGVEETDGSASVSIDSGGSFNINCGVNSSTIRFYWNTDPTGITRENSVTMPPIQEGGMMALYKDRLTSSPVTYSDIYGSPYATHTGYANEMLGASYWTVEGTTNFLYIRAKQGTNWVWLQLQIANVFTN